jgi:hypothetical protein
MTTFAKKTLTAAVAALSIGAAVTMSAGTAEAKGGKAAAIAGGTMGDANVSEYPLLMAQRQA